MILLWRICFVVQCMIYLCNKNVFIVSVAMEMDECYVILGGNCSLVSQMQGFAVFVWVCL